ncbi:hypothetical protein DPMN_013524 [Dreissena polymorpha]|uniref:Uncharacterized protein n=1 Tax=Dreissena polymorpha TaxID=45954 RepID=A0A9D4S3U8_DREPO|nr:hypothetical protein DPMN_013524 [Dreissena polymorpha]
MWLFKEVTDTLHEYVVARERPARASKPDGCKGNVTLHKKSLAYNEFRSISSAQALTATGTVQKNPRNESANINRRKCHFCFASHWSDEFDEYKT